MKKISKYLLILLLCLSFITITACGKKDKKKGNDDVDPTPIDNPKQDDNGDNDHQDDAKLYQLSSDYLAFAEANKTNGYAIKISTTTGNTTHEIVVGEKGSKLWYFKDAAGLLMEDADEFKTYSYDASLLSFTIDASLQESYAQTAEAFRNKKRNEINAILNVSPSAQLKKGDSEIVEGYSCDKYENTTTLNGQEITITAYYNTTFKLIMKFESTVKLEGIVTSYQEYHILSIYQGEDVKVPAICKLSFNDMSGDFTIGFESRETIQKIGDDILCYDYWNNANYNYYHLCAYQTSNNETAYRYEKYSKNKMSDYWENESVSTSTYYYSIRECLEDLGFGFMLFTGINLFENLDNPEEEKDLLNDYCNVYYYTYGTKEYRLYYNENCKIFTKIAIYENNSTIDEQMISDFSNECEKFATQPAF